MGLKFVLGLLDYGDKPPRVTEDQPSMSSFDITPIATGLLAAAGQAPPPVLSPAPSLVEDAVRVELSATAQAAGTTADAGQGTAAAIPDTPPVEVMEAVLAAQHAYEGLAAAGHTLQFDIDPRTHRVSVTVVDEHGAPQGQIPPSRALDIATAASKLTEGH